MGQVAHKKQKTFLALKIVHFLASVALFYVVWLLFRYGKIPVEKERGFRYNYLITVAYFVLLYCFLRVYNAYLFGYSRIRALTIAQFMAQCLSCVIVYVSVTIAWAKVRNPSFFLLLLFVQGLLDCVFSYGTSILFRKTNPPKRSLLIYRNDLDKKRFGSMIGKPVGLIYEVTEEYQFDRADYQEIEKRLDGFEAIFVAGVNSRVRNGIVKYCVEHDVPGFFLPHVGDVLMKGSQHIQTFSSPVHYLSYKHNNPEYILVKRFFDFVASLLAIIFLSPLMLLVAVAIKAYDRGPAIYKQVRLTKGGKEFEIMKFRSMRVDSEKDGIARLSSGDQDDRITPIGRFVRKCRLDELPQLFNILKGEMSFVGPRPERPEIAEQYYKSLPGFKMRLQVKAGLTGYAQVYGKYNSDPYEKLEFDLLYINDMSILTDLTLILATFTVLFVSESTEGVAEGSPTAMDYESISDCSKKQQ